MGVINLGLLVEKVMKKLEGAGFIKSTDYATASKAGVIKIGEGLNIDNTGKVSASAGMTMDVLWTGNVSATTTDIVLAYPISDYKIITAYQDHNSVTTGAPSDILIEAGMWLDGLTGNTINIGQKNVSIVTDGTKAAKVYTGSSTVYNVSIVGIK